MATAGPGSRARGVATGLLTGTLAVAAHGVAGGALPAGAATALLVVLAATVGAFAALSTSAAKPVVLVGLLGAGQLVGHLLLSVAGHHHAASTVPSASTMLVAHVLAVVLGASLIVAGERLWCALSRAVRAVGLVVWPVVGTRVVAVRRVDQPLRSALLLAASVSHRGPPVSFTH